jgi:hypothetical protein
MIGGAIAGNIDEGKARGVQMRWRSKRAMRWRRGLWIAAGLCMCLLIWTHQPGIIFAVAVWSALSLLLVIEICPHCGIPLMWKPQTRLWRRTTICSNCRKEIR